MSATPCSQLGDLCLAASSTPCSVTHLTRRRPSTGDQRRTAYAAGSVPDLTSGVWSPAAPGANVRHRSRPCLRPLKQRKEWGVGLRMWSQVRWSWAQHGRRVWACCDGLAQQPLTSPSHPPHPLLFCPSLTLCWLPGAGDHHLQHVDQG